MNNSKVYILGTQELIFEWYDIMHENYWKYLTIYEDELFRNLFERGVSEC